MLLSNSRVTRSSEHPEEITELLRQWRQGNTGAGDSLFQIVEPNLRKLAHYLMRREWREQPLQATELVSEAYLELLAAKDRDWQNRKHFFALAATIMRRYLVDVARRAGPVVLSSEPSNEMTVDSPEQAVALGELLDQLTTKHADWGTVVEMKYFLGFTDEEVSRELSMPLRTVQRIWHDARRWLFEHWAKPTEAGLRRWTTC